MAVKYFRSNNKGKPKYELADNNSTEPQTEAPTELSTETKSPEEPIRWVCLPTIECDNVIPGNQIVPENSSMRYHGGDWRSRVLIVDYLEQLGSNNWSYTQGIADYYGNIILPTSSKVDLSVRHGGAYIDDVNDWGAFVDINGNRTGEYAGGIGDEFVLYYFNTYDNKVVYLDLYYEHIISIYDITDIPNEMEDFRNIYYETDYRVGEEIDYSKLTMLDTYSVVNCRTGKCVATVDNVIYSDSLNGIPYKIVKKENAVSYIDSNGQKIVPGEYQGAAPFREGIAAVEMDNKAGFINTS